MPYTKEFWLMKSQLVHVMAFVAEISVTKVVHAMVSAGQTLVRTNLSIGVFIYNKRSDRPAILIRNI